MAINTLLDLQIYFILFEGYFPWSLDQGKQLMQMYSLRAPSPQIPWTF